MERAIAQSKLKRLTEACWCKCKNLFPSKIDWGTWKECKRSSEIDPFSQGRNGEWESSVVACQAEWARSEQNSLHNSRDPQWYWLGKGIEKEHIEKVWVRLGPAGGC